MKYILVAFLFVSAFSCIKESKNTSQKTKIINFYMNQTEETKHINTENKSAYILSGGYPFGKTLQAKNIYVAKMDSNKNIIYEFRTLHSNSVLFMSGNNINNSSFPYYLNIFDKNKCKSFFIGDYIINENTYINDIDSIYLKNKEKSSFLCCSSEKMDWKYTGARNIIIDSCQSSLD